MSEDAEHRRDLSERSFLFTTAVRPGSTPGVAHRPDFGVWSWRMEICRHAVLTALPLAPRRLRCTVCHLTISEEELAGASCPECFEARGERNDDFEVIEADSNVVKYRCEACGVVVVP